MTNWCWQEGSNSRPPRYEGGALPTELCQRVDCQAQSIDVSDRAGNQISQSGEAYRSRGALCPRAPSWTSRFALSREFLTAPALGVGDCDQATKDAALAQRQRHVQRGGARTRNDAVTALVSSLKSCFDEPGHFALSPVEAEGHGGPPPG
jgi:hypothetical protein